MSGTARAAHACEHTVDTDKQGHTHTTPSTCVMRPLQSKHKHLDGHELRLGALHFLGIEVDAHLPGELQPPDLLLGRLAQLAVGHARKLLLHPTRRRIPAMVARDCRAAKAPERRPVPRISPAPPCSIPCSAYLGRAQVALRTAKLLAGAAVGMHTMRYRSRVSQPTAAHAFAWAHIPCIRPAPPHANDLPRLSINPERAPERPC